MTSDSPDTLSRLHQELEQKLSQRLDEIEQDYRSRAEQLEQEKQRLSRARINRLRQGHASQLRQLRLRSRRDIQTRQQQRYWQCQQDCIDEILADTRQLLEQRPPDQDYLKGWLAQIGELRNAASDWQLRLSPRWSEAITSASIDAETLSVSAAPMLGGAMLASDRMHIEIDGSWDQRLQTLIPELWQQWLNDVGTNGQD